MLSCSDVSQRSLTKKLERPLDRTNKKQHTSLSCYRFLQCDR
jgi:hypothetical protein